MTDSQKSNKNTFFGMDISSINENINRIRKLISEKILLIEFNYQALIISEAVISSNQIQIDKFVKTDLPVEALDRSIPTDPEKISDLIKSICIENSIFANTCYVIISPEAVFNKLINLPSDLNKEEAIDFALTPNSSLGIPIPLSQTDFDIQETSISLIKKDNKEYISYFLRSIPKELIDRLIESINLSELELGYLDTPSVAFSRLIQDDLKRLFENKFIIVIEFLKNCSYVYFYDRKSTLSTTRLPAIRNFPEPNQNVLDEKRKKPFISLEELITRQDDYLPISELDLRVFIKELKLVINNFMKNNKKFKPEEIFLTGINSLYPEIVDLISNKLNLKTTRIKTINQESFGNVNIPSELFPQELSRIFGLALSLQNGESATQIVNGKKLNDNSENIKKIKKNY